MSASVACRAQQRQRVLLLYTHALKTTLSSAGHRDLCSMQEIRKSKEEYDVVIIGGGMVGAAVCCGLASNTLTHSLRVAIIDSNPMNGSVQRMPRDAIPDSRVSAITPTTVAFLKGIDVWKDVKKCRHAPFDSMQVWDYTGLGYTRYNAADIGKDVLGYVVENKVLLSALHSCIQDSGFAASICPARVKAIRMPEHVLPHLSAEEWESKAQRNINTSLPSATEEVAKEKEDANVGHGLAQVELEDGRCLLTRLVVGADGARSKVRTMVGLQTLNWDYKQHAIICSVQTEKNHSTAWQRFLPTGPLAVLPMGDSFSNIVWSTSPEKAFELKTMRDEDFAASINQALREDFGPFPSSTISGLLNDRFGSLWGGLTPSSSEPFEAPPRINKCLSARLSFPLSLGHAYKYASHRVVLVGDAAHTVHPLAGQGVNLGFGDAASLVNVLSTGIEHGSDIGEVSLLNKYESERMFANIPMMAILDGFQRVFSMNFAPINAARAVAFRAVQLLGPLKQQVISYAIGEGGLLKHRLGF